MYVFKLDNYADFPGASQSEMINQAKVLVDNGDCH